MDVPTELVATPFKQWQLNLTTLSFLAYVAGRAYSALRNGGGLVGIWKGVVFGENIPKPIAREFREEMKANPSQL